MVAALAILNQAPKIHVLARKEIFHKKEKILSMDSSMDTVCWGAIMFQRNIFFSGQNVYFRWAGAAAAAPTRKSRLSTHLRHLYFSG